MTPEDMKQNWGEQIAEAITKMSDMEFMAFVLSLPPDDDVLNTFMLSLEDEATK